MRYRYTCDIRFGSKQALYKYIDREYHYPHKEIQIADDLLQVSDLSGTWEVTEQGIRFARIFYIKKLETEYKIVVMRITEYKPKQLKK